jgi:hypothetical protein
VSRIRKKTFYLQFYMGTSKFKKTKNSYWICTTKFAGSTQNHKKIIETRNQLIKTKFFSKKLCLVPQKCKGAEIMYGSYPIEFAGSAQNPEKIIGTSNQLIKMKISQK